MPKSDGFQANSKQFAKSFGTVCSLVRADEIDMMSRSFLVSTVIPKVSGLGGS